MATVCFERAGDVYREKWARASGLRASAEYFFHSNIENARVLLTEAAKIYETIGKVESAASCYIELKEFRNAGTLYLEKCGESRLKDAAECFGLAGCWSRAAEVYAKGGYLSECLSVCSKGNLFETGLWFIECWKGNAFSDVGSKKLDKTKDSFMERCALHYHEPKDTKHMMMFVQAFSSVEYARKFLKSWNYLDELLAMEAKFGNFMEAARIARIKLDPLLEANMLEKAGHYEEASKLIITHVVVNSLWVSGNEGWPMKQFIGKEDLLEKAKMLAKLKSHNFFEPVCIEASILTDKENSLAHLVKILNTSRNLGNIIAEVFSSRKALDIHLHSDPSKFLWENELYLNSEEHVYEKLLHNVFSSEILIFVCNIWRETIEKVLESLGLVGTYS